MKKVDALQEKDRYTQALPIAEQAVQSARNTFGPESLQMAESLKALGDVHEKLSDYDQALPQFERALKIRETKLSPGHHDIAESLQDLAGIYEDLDRYDEAEPLYLRAIRICEKARGPNHPQVGEIAHDLAWLYSDQGRYSEAAALYERALAIDEKHFGPNHAKVATDLNSLAGVYQELSRYADAERLYRRALRIREKHSPDSVDTSVTLDDLGNLLEEEGKYTEAEPLLIRSLAISEKIYGPDHPDVATSLEGLAELYNDEGRYRDAEKLNQRALRIREKKLDPDNVDVATSLGGLAQTERMLGQYAEAEKLDARALQIREKRLGPDHPDVSISAYKLAIDYDYEGRYAEAEKLHQRSLAIDEKKFGPNHPRVAASLNSLAGVYLNQGRYAEAEPLFERALKIREEALGAWHPGTASALSSLSLLRYYQGRYPEAEPLARRVLAIREKALGAAHPEIASALTSLANLHLYQGRYAEAKPLYDRALQIREKIFGPNHPAVATSLEVIARLYSAQGKYADAAPFAERALSIREAVLGPEHPDTATSAAGLAVVYYRQDRYAEAEKLHLRALAIREKVLGPEHNVTGVTANDLALVYWKQGRNADAEPLFRRSLAIDEKVWGANYPLLVAPLFNLARVRFALKDLQDAQALFLRGFDVLFRRLQYSFAYMGQTERLELLSTMDYSFSNFFSLVEANPGDATAVSAMYDLLLWQKGMVANSIVALRRRTAATGDPEALKLLDQLSALHTRIAQLSSASASGQIAGQAGDDRATLVALDEQAREIEKALVTRSGGESRTIPTWKDIRKLLKPGAAAVEFVRYNFSDSGPAALKPHYAALVLTPDSTTGPRFVPLGDADAIEGQPYREYKQWIAPPEEGQPLLPGLAIAPALHDAVWKPIEHALGDAHTIYVSPDGILSQVSLGILPSSDGRLLMDRYDLRIISSTRDMIGPAAPAQADTAVLVGNPDFLLTDKEHLKAVSGLSGIRTEDELPAIVSQVMRRSGLQEMQRGGCDSSEVPIHGVSCPLPGTGEEVDAIYGLPKARGWQVEPPFAGPRALEEVVKGVHHPRILHLATHGYFKQDQRAKDGAGVEATILADPMLRSGLLFAGVDRILNREEPLPHVDDGMLTALEASGLDLQGTELVVLSACETGLGQYRTGEGVFGLQRAFAQAGAGSILMTMWKVPDESTHALITAFYTNWLSGMDKHQALLKAKQEIRGTSPSPYFWGAFVLVGQ